MSQSYHQPLDLIQVIAQLNQEGYLVTLLQLNQPNYMWQASLVDTKQMRGVGRGNSPVEALAAAEVDSKRVRSQPIVKQPLTYSSIRGQSRGKVTLDEL